MILNSVENATVRASAGIGTTSGEWKWAEDAFQTIACRQGYRPKRFRHFSNWEIAVVTELAVLQHSPAQRQGLRIEPEWVLPLVQDIPSESIPDYRQKRVDITLGSTNGPAHHTIEVKVLNEIGCSKSETMVGDLKRRALEVSKC